LISSPGAGVVLSKLDTTGLESIVELMKTFAVRLVVGGGGVKVCEPVVKIKSPPSLLLMEFSDTIL
jgi:hypothetical protein